MCLAIASDMCVSVRERFFQARLVLLESNRSTIRSSCNAIGSQGVPSGFMILKRILHMPDTSLPPAWEIELLSGLARLATCIRGVCQRTGISSSSLLLSQLLLDLVTRTTSSLQSL